MSTKPMHDAILDLNFNRNDKLKDFLNAGPDYYTWFESNYPNIIHSYRKNEFNTMVADAIKIFPSLNPNVSQNPRLSKKSHGPDSKFAAHILALCYDPSLSVPNEDVVIL